MAEQRDHLVGVIGFPIEHSISPAMHNAAFAALGMMGWRYEKMPVPPDVLRQSLRELRDHGVIGINVTIPHKRAVMAYVRADAVAKAVGAVNVIDFRAGVGTNTDVSGFIDDLTAQGVDPHGMRAVVLGAGGAARAAVYGLARAGAHISVLNRSPEHAARLIEELGAPARLGAFEDLALADLVVNCTPAGMFPKTDTSPLPNDVALRAGVIGYDMVYRPARTRMMAQIEAAGGRAIGGLGMLVRQGAAAFALWTGLPAPIEVMFEAARTSLES